MPIIIIEKSKNHSAEEQAQMLRGGHIAAGCGVLLVQKSDGKGQHDPRHQIEKILNGARFPDQPPLDLNQLPWKKTPLIIVPVDNESMLDEFERILPGFGRFFGPVSRQSFK